MGITHETPVRNGICSYIDSQAGSFPKLKIYTDLTLTTLLATFFTPTFGTPASGTMAMGAITPVTASASGDAGAFALTDTADVVVYSGDCGVTGSGAAAILNTTTIVSGATISCNSLSYTAPP
jgi:hypothetical protein